MRACVHACERACVHVCVCCEIADMFAGFNQLVPGPKYPNWPTKGYPSAALSNVMFSNTRVMKNDTMFSVESTDRRRCFCSKMFSVHDSLNLGEIVIFFNSSKNKVPNYDVCLWKIINPDDGLFQYFSRSISISSTLFLRIFSILYI